MIMYITRRESIILSAIDIIDDLGINELSLREIGNRQGISDSALYKHFKNKEELILEVLEYYSRFDFSIMMTIEESSLKAKEAIILFVKSITEVYENQPSIICVTNSFEILNTKNPAELKAKEIFISRLDFLKKLVSNGQAEGSISLDIDSEDLADAILGYMRIVILKWRIQKYCFPLKSRIINGVQAILSKY